MTLQEAIDQARARYWTVDIGINHDGFRLQAMRGDCNCPHKKPYSPTDGHGCEYVDNDDIEDPTTLDEVVAWIAALPELKR